MQRLRGPGGCPWDREQTHESLRPYLLEESYEVLEAMDSGDDDEFRDELGDLLLQVVFHAQLARERDAFDSRDVIQAICEKLVRRHPHVFGDGKAVSAEEVSANWSRIKTAERIAKNAASDQTPPSAVDGIPEALPSLLRAHRIGEKASHAGFDWSHPRDVESKILEELEEVREAGDQRPELEEELGDLLFAVVSYTRLHGFNAEIVLGKAVLRFDQRFRCMEQELSKSGKNLNDYSAAELEQAWRRAKITSRPSKRQHG